MGKNLEAKVGNLLDDIDGLSREDQKKLIIGFVNNELGWHSAEHTIDNYDLTVIHSNAVREMTDFPIGHIRSEGLDGPDQSKLRTLCYLRAVIGHLRKEGYIPFINLKHKGKR